MMSAQTDETQLDQVQLGQAKIDQAKSDQAKPGGARSASDIQSASGAQLASGTRSDKAKVIVCQNKTCKQQGSERVLAAFRRSVPANVLVEPSGCLGQCGNGPTAIVIAEAERSEAAELTDAKQAEPDKAWYSRVRPADAFVIAAHHFNKDAKKDAEAQSQARSSSQQSTVWIWLVGVILFLALCALMALVLGGPAHYG